MARSARRRGRSGSGASPERSISTSPPTTASRTPSRPLHEKSKSSTPSMCGAARSSPSRSYDQAWYGQRSRLRTWPSASSTSRAPRWRQTLRKARGVPSSPPMITTLSVPSSRTMNLPGSSTAETCAGDHPAAEDLVELPLEHRRVGERGRRQHRRPLDGPLGERDVARVEVELDRRIWLAAHAPGLLNRCRALTL